MNKMKRKIGIAILLIVLSVSIVPAMASGAYITVASPNGGENWVRGTVHTVKWTYSGIAGNVKIELLKGGSYNSLITSSTTNDGSHSWTIPSGQALGNDYKVRITSISNPTIKDTSNYNFIISSGYANAKFYSNKRIYTQIPLELVQLTLQSTGTVPIWVKQSEAWKIVNVVTGKTVSLPICVPYGYSSCGPKKLLPWEKITKGWNQKDSSGNLVPPGTYAASAKYYKQNPTYGSPTAYIVYTIFTIVPKPINSITVSSPNGGENWKRGTYHTITWRSIGSTGTNVKIELLKAGVTISTITSSTANDGSYGWTVPSGITIGNDYKIKITSSSGYKDTSDNYFTISNGYIIVISPNGGESWKRGTTKTITWKSGGYAGTNVKIELLKSGIVKQTIASSTANDGSQTWTIPTWLPIGSDYKIRIISVNNPLYKDLSNSNFRIY